MAPPKKQPVETVSMQDLGKGKALETTLANLNKKYGEGVVMKLGEATKLNIEAIPSGSLSLDIALGVAAIPKAASSRSTARRAPARRPSACI